MNKIKAFTLMEVMVSIFIFSTSMLGFMAFHAHSMAVLFENESAQMAHSMAFNMVDEINAMAYDSFHSFVAKSNEWLNDWEVEDLLGDTFKSSPFNSFGKKVATSSAEPYKFYRAIEVTSYSSQTGTYVQEGTYLSTLYQIEIRVAWPKKEKPNANCDSSNYSTAKCNSVSIPLIRSDKQ